MSYMNIFKSKFSLKDEAAILNTLSMYLSAHISLSEALAMLAEQTESKRKKETFLLWKDSVEAGKSVSHVFERGEGMKVSGISTNAARLGERSGSLSDSFKSAHEQVEKLLIMKKKIIGAVAYPFAILIGTLCLVVGLLLFVFPKIVPLFKTLKVTLPLSTRILIWVSETLSKQWWMFLLVIVGVILSVILLWRFSPRAQNFFRAAVLRIPIIGHIFRTRILYSIFDSTYVLLRGQEQLSEVLKNIAITLKFIEYAVLLEKASELVSEGKSLSVFFREEKKKFPLYISGIVSVGEKTGNMENSMKSVSDILRTELDDKIRILTAALEPILMVSMSFVIGFIALSIILPIYGITSHFQNV